MAAWDAGRKREHRRAQGSSLHFAMFAFQLLAEALGETLAQGKARWHRARQRLRRRELQLPPTTRAKPPGARQMTPRLAANDAAKALAMVLKDPLEEFFQKEDKLTWLRTEVRTAGGDPETVDAARTELLAEKARREADAQSLLLPGLPTGSAEMRLRTIRKGEEVLGSVLDYLRWLGLSDAAAEWCHWMREEFRTHEDSSNVESGKILHVERIFPGQHIRTPFTNFAGYRLLTELCLRKSKIAQGLYNEALKVLGRVSVGDQRLHETLDANAASSSGEARAPLCWGRTGGKSTGTSAARQEYSGGSGGRHSYLCGGRRRGSSGRAKASCQGRTRASIQGVFAAAA